MFSSLRLLSRPSTAISTLNTALKAGHLVPPSLALHSPLTTTTTFRLAAMKTPQLQIPLPGKEDKYDGIILDSPRSDVTPDEFKSTLTQSLIYWKSQQKKGIWLKVPLQQSELISHAVDLGFVFHHAEPQYVMMTTWLADTENKLPANASHQCGVGAFVMNEHNQVLVVTEKNGPLRGTGVWKMPTGLVTSGEDITEAAEREVLEETGIKAKFAAVLAMRQAHGFAFGKSDIFFVIALKPEPGQVELTPQPDEIDEAKWLSLEEFAAGNPFMNSRPLLRKIVDRCVAYANGQYAGLCGRKLESGTADRRDLLLFGETPGDEEGGASEDAWIGV